MLSATWELGSLAFLVLVSWVPSEPLPPLGQLLVSCPNPFAASLGLRRLLLRLVLAPRAAFGPGAGPAPVDPAASAAFARNAASGAELVDLGALLNNPAFRAATGAAGLGLFGAGVAGMMPGDRTGGRLQVLPLACLPRLLCSPKRMAAL
jgi:hypothetical protein